MAEFQVAATAALQQGTYSNMPRAPWAQTVEQAAVSASLPASIAA